MIPSLSTYVGVFLARCVALLGPFGAAVITARVLGPEDRGRYYYVITLATIGAQLASLGIHSSNTFVVSKDPNLAPQILVNTAWIAVVLGIAGALAAILFDRALGDAMQLQAGTSFVLVLCPLTLLFLYLSNLAVAVSRSRLFNGLIVFNGVALLLTTAAAALWAPTLSAFLLAAAATGLLSCAAAWTFLAPGLVLSWRFDWPLFASSIGFALRAHVIILLGFLMLRTSPVILRQGEAFSDLGQWSVAAQIAEALLLLPSTVSLLLYPALVRADPEARWIALRSTLFRMGIVMLLICLTFALIAGFAIDIVFGPAYAPAAGILVALLPAVFLLSLTSIVSQFLTALGIPTLQIAGWAVTWSIQILLSILMFKSHGVVGLAWAQSACAGLICVWLLATVAHYSPQRLPQPVNTADGPLP